jgi:integrase
MRPDLAELLHGYLEGKPAGQPVWPGKADAPFESWHHHAAKLVRADLKAAGITYNDAEGRVFEFHALRHQFVSNLAAAGIHPKIAQALARHSTIALTMDKYTHLGLVDQTAALDKLPKLPGFGTTG